MARRKTTNKKEEEWENRVRARGCIVSSNLGYEDTPAQIHHIKGRTYLEKGGPKGLGLWLILPLSYHFHQSGVKNDKICSLHPFKKEFERRYGTQMELFDQLCEEINGGHYPWEKLIDY